MAQIPNTREFWNKLVNETPIIGNPYNRIAETPTTTWIGAGIIDPAFLIDSSGFEIDVRLRDRSAPKPAKRAVPVPPKPSPQTAARRAQFTDDVVQAALAAWNVNVRAMPEPAKTVTASSDVAAIADEMEQDRQRNPRPWSDNGLNWQSSITKTETMTREQAAVAYPRELTAWEKNQARMVTERAIAEKQARAETEAREELLAVKLPRKERLARINGVLTPELKATYKRVIDEKRGADVMASKALRALLIGGSF